MSYFEAQAGPQSRFLQSTADIVIYGGAAGGGKSWAILAEPLYHKDTAGFYALILRKTYPEITNPGGLWDESYALYRGGVPTKGDLTWRFNAGSRVEFGHLQYDTELIKYDGAQIGLLEFDQLEHFSERSFFYLLARNRATTGIPPYCRCTCNPDPDSFLVTGKGGFGTGFISWWIAEDGYANLDRVGRVRWFVRTPDEVLHWADDAETLQERFPLLHPLSVTFIVASVYDNKILMEKDPGYLAKLQALPYIERERFLGDAKRGGNWKIKAGAGKVFNRDWFKVVQAAPDGGIEGDGWDFAATIESQDSPDPDYTCRVRVRKVNGQYYVMSMVNERWAVGEIDSLLLNTCQVDCSLAKAGGARHFLIRWENEPGSAGLRVTNHMQRLLIGYDARGVPITGDKMSRAMPLAAAVQAGLVNLVAGPWVDSLLAIFHAFPEGKHDDPIDAFSVIFNEITDMENPANEPDKLQGRPVGYPNKVRLKEVFHA